MEFRKKNYHRALKHFIIAAKAGDEHSLDTVKRGYVYSLDEGKKGRTKLVTKDEYTNTLRAYQNRQDQMKSKERQDAVDFKELFDMIQADPHCQRLVENREAFRHVLSEMEEASTGELAGGSVPGS